MAASTWVLISFMVLLSLAICSAQPVGVFRIKSKETDHHNHKAHTLSNINIEGFGVGGGGGFDIGGDEIRIGGSGRARGGFGIDVDIGSGGGGGIGVDIDIGDGGDYGVPDYNVPGYGPPNYRPRFGVPDYNVPGYAPPNYRPGFRVPPYNIPGYVSPIHRPDVGVPGYSPDCGYVCPANNPRGEITEFKIVGLSDSTRPYRCRPGLNKRANKDYSSELLLNFVTTMQDKHKKKQHLRYEGDHGDVRLHVGRNRRFGMGRGSGRGAGSYYTSEYAIDDPGYGSPSGCGYVCPGNGPSGANTVLHISGLSHFNGPYRCRSDICDSENCDEFLLHFASPMHNKDKNQHDHLVETSEEEEADHQSEEQEEEAGHQSEQQEEIKN
ncbi:unnamed protein product [Withania somnifera]